VAQWLDLGLNALVQSPQHYSCIGTVPEDVDAFAYTYHGYSYYCNGVLIPRGTAFTGQWLTEFDASIIFHLPLPRKIDASLRLDVFNLFNSKAVTSYNEAGELSNGVSNSEYRLPVDYQTPRYLRLTARIGF
jgi:outer membrane receptor protein involved in Fe transport